MEFAIGQILTQIIAFLLMLWVLKKFAWKPLLSIMDERQQKIRGEFDKIEQDKIELKKLTDDYEKQIQEIKEKGREIIEDAVKQGRIVAQEIQLDTQHKAREILRKAQEETQRELKKAKMQLKEDLVHISVLVFEKLAKIKLDEKESDKLIEKLIEEVQFK
jgi:F-type H+-transporting ATPase subunit b